MSFLSTQPVIELQQIVKKYRVGDEELAALDGVNLQIYPGDLMAIMGPSGSGKSTLMNIIGLLDRPTTGRYLLHKKDITTLDDRELARIRNQTIGFIFQSFVLLPRLTVLDNVGLPLFYRKCPKQEIDDRAHAMIEKVGLSEFADYKPSHLSGGGQQRVAIARALVGEPIILLADEPTGALDSHTGQKILDLFFELNTEEHVTVVIITHDPHVANQCKRVIQIQDGRIVSE